MKNGSIKSISNVNWHVVAPGVWGLKDIFVNVYFIHNPVDKKWVLVDTGASSVVLAGRFTILIPLLLNYPSRKIVRLLFLF